MRLKYQDIARDGNGCLISSATVTAYLAGTTTLATIYTSSTSTSGVNSVTTGTDGSFTLYVDAADYALPYQTFKLVISKDGFTSTTIDNITINDVVLGTYTISTAKAYAYDIEIPQGVFFAKSGVGTLTFSKSFTAPQCQVFSGFTKGVDVTFTIVPLAIYDIWFDGTSATNTITTATITTANLTTVNKTGTTVVTNLNADLLDGKHAGAASGVATLDANTRIVEAANLVWDGTAARGALPTPAANTIPVSDSNKTLPFAAEGIALFGTNTIFLKVGSTYTATNAGIAAGAEIEAEVDLVGGGTRHYVMPSLSFSLANVLLSENIAWRMLIRGSADSIESYEGGSGTMPAWPATPTATNKIKLRMKNNNAGAADLVPYFMILNLDTN